MRRPMKRGGPMRVIVAGVLLLCVVAWWKVMTRVLPQSPPVIDMERWEECTQCSKCESGVVRYGSGIRWIVRKVCDPTLQWECGKGAFGDADPWPGMAKTCQCQAAGPAPLSVDCIGSGPCVDLLSTCQAQVDQGMCTSSSVASSCRKSCNHCPLEKKPPPRSSTSRLFTKPNGIMKQVDLMHNEPKVRFGAMREATAKKYPTGERPNPMQSACRHKGDATEKLLAKAKIAPKVASPKIMCLVYTMTSRKEAMDAVWETYGPECDGFAFMSTETHAERQELRVHHKGPEEYHNMWQKSRSIWAFVADEEEKEEQHDWFIIGGDDLYIVVDNLRAYLASDEIVKASEGGTKPMYLGRRFNESKTHFLFNSGGAGYVLNRAALRLLATRLDNPQCDPETRTSAEDREVAVCLSKNKVGTYDTRDALGEERFMPFSPDLHYSYRAANYKKDWYKEYTIGLKEGLEAMSPEVISFHYMKPPMMRRTHALLFHCPPGSGIKGRWQPCAEEGGFCMCKGETRYGAWLCDTDDGCPSFVIEKNGYSGQCSNEGFGKDPAPGTAKVCQCAKDAKAEKKPAKKA